MKRMMGLFVLAMAAIATLNSCKKDPLKNMTGDESRIYITNKDSTANFASYKTFSIVDSVSEIDNNRLAGKSSTAWDQQFIAAVAAAMQARGYVRVSHTQSPDLGINVSRLYNTTTNVVDMQGYWGDYGGYYDPYYWGYGGYGYNFPSYALYQSTEAALSVDMLDLKNASANGSIKGIWNGLIRGSGIFSTTTVDSQVKALFDQSPYIKSIQ